MSITRKTRDCREALQQIADGISRDPEEREEAARLHVAICVLLEAANFASEFHNVTPGGEVRLVHDLISICDAVLRIVVFIAERRISRAG